MAMTTIAAMGKGEESAALEELAPEVATGTIWIPVVVTTPQVLMEVSEAERAVEGPAGPAGPAVKKRASVS